MRAEERQPDDGSGDAVYLTGVLAAAVTVFWLFVVGLLAIIARWS